MKLLPRRFWIGALLVSLLPAAPGRAVAAPADDHWVVTWAAASQQPPAGRGGRGGPAPISSATPVAPAATAPPVPAPAPAAPPPAAIATGYHNQTLRMFVRASIGGRRVRVQLSNAFGTAPLTIGAAHLALHAKDAA